MGNIGRKGKGRCSGTILAGAFTVPTVMSAVQQNVVSANLYGANMPKGLTTAVSKSYAKGVSTKYLTKFLEFAAYVFFPTAIAVLTVISLYQFGKYLTRYNYWKVLSCDKQPYYSEAQRSLFGFLEDYGRLLGIENTELEVDSGVLLGILDLDENRNDEDKNYEVKNDEDENDEDKNDEDKNDKDENDEDENNEVKNDKDENDENENDEVKNDKDENDEDENNENENNENENDEVKNDKDENDEDENDKDDNEKAKNLLKKKERVRISINKIYSRGYLELRIEGVDGCFTTKFFDNNDPKIIELLNKILEQSNKKNKNNVEFVLEGQGGNIFLKVTKDKVEQFKINMSEVEGRGRKVRKIKKLLEEPVIVNDNVGEEDGDFDFWKALKEEENPNYYTELNELFNFMSHYGEDLGIDGKKVKVDPQVLLGALRDGVMLVDGKEGEMINFLKNQHEGTVAVYIEWVGRTGYLDITIENKYETNTKYFANNIPGVIKFFNKILAQSGKENKDNLELEWDRDKRDILLKQKNTNNKINVGDYDTADFKDKMKELLEGQGDLNNEEFNPWKILKHNEEPVDTPKDKKDLFSFLRDYSENLNLNEIEVDPGVLLKVLHYEELAKVKKFLRKKSVENEKVTVSITGVNEDGYLTLELKKEKMESPYVVNTKFFDNDIIGIINFFNKIFEQTSEGRNPVFKKENEGIFLEVAGGPKVNISRDEDGNYLEKDLAKKMANFGELLTNGHWGVLSSKLQVTNYTQSLRDVLGTLGSLSDWYELEVNPSVLLSVLDKNTSEEVKEMLKSKGNEMVAVSMKVRAGGGFLTFNLKNSEIDTDFFVNDTDKVINFFNKIFEKNMKKIVGIKNINNNIKPVLEKKGDKVFLKAIDIKTKEVYGSIEAKEYDADVEGFKKIIEEGPGAENEGEDYLNKEDKDIFGKIFCESKKEKYDPNLRNLLLNLKDINETLNILEESKVEATTDSFLEDLNGEGYVEIKNLLDGEEMATVSIKDIIQDKKGEDEVFYLLLKIKNEKGESAKAYTKPFVNNTDKVIDFFNRIFEKSGKVNIRIELDEKGNKVLFKAKDKNKRDIVLGPSGNAEAAKKIMENINNHELFDQNQIINEQN